MQFIAEKNALVARRGGETLRIEGWGHDSLRVHAVMYDGWTGNDWALTEKPEVATCEVQIGQDTDGTPCAQIRNGRIGHAYLFTGTRGTGKTSVAKILAKAVNCLDPKDGEPCNCCEHCPLRLPATLGGSFGCRTEDKVSVAEESCRDAKHLLL